MLILTIRTDKPDAEIGLYNGQKQLAHETWQAHRQLAETLHQKLENLLSSRSYTLQDIKGIICFKGPGSFTGLRIGLTVGNALAYSLGVPIVSDGDNEWIQKGITRLCNNQNESISLPEYGSPVHITLPKQ